MDCDFSHDPHDLVRLRIPCAEGGAGMSVGSRYVKGGGVANWPVNRMILSYGASIYVNTILRLGVRDSTAGFVCYRRETLQAIQLDAVQFVGYAFQIEMKLRAKRNGFAVKEVPITFVDRELGTSKMSMNISAKPFWACFKCGSSASFFPPNPEFQRSFPAMSLATLFLHAHVVTDGAVRVQDVLVDGEHIVAVGVNLAEQAPTHTSRHWQKRGSERLHWVVVDAWMHRRPSALPGTWVDAQGGDRD